MNESHSIRHERNPSHIMKEYGVVPYQKSGEKQLTTTWSHHNLSKSFMKGQNNSTKTSDNKKQKSQTAMFTNTHAQLYKCHPFMPLTQPHCGHIET